MSTALTALPRPERPRPTPPARLSKPGRALWRAILAEFDLDAPHQFAQLLIACEAADTIAACRAAIDADGMFVMSRFDTLRNHPAVEVAERASRLQLAAFRALELDVAEVLAATGIR